MESIKFLKTCRVLYCSVWKETVVCIFRFSVSKYTVVRLYIKFVFMKM